MLSEEDYHDDDFADAVNLVNTLRRLHGIDAIRASVAIAVFRKHAEEDRIIGREMHMSTYRELIYKRKELRDATNNTLKQSNAGQADSTPSKLNTP
jgi:hypothetical protein